ncbi:mitochondrial ribosomal protein L16 [Calocera cornea HHB12733]|uniref:Mitochondrial ribosomal protein L16 n=1 Tax=Calocera cornea HHB12733 TaxID=1353952 RepID=A0A165JCD2_9BASI|nr:mitochondrial ribosomal protein L16 [Calocera cornea HHB12733]
MASLLSSFSRLTLNSRPSRPIASTSFRAPILPARSQIRFAGVLAPKRSKYKKAHKGRVPIPTGGSLKGTTIVHGEYGIRVKGNGMRLSAKQLTSADTALKRKLKVLKSAKIWLRVFPDIPVCVKGNEVRMGKGKGGFDHWAVRCPTGRVIFEVGGDGVSEQLARDALRLVAGKLPCQVEFITRKTGPKLGNLQLSRDVLTKPNVVGALMAERNGVPVPFESASTPAVALHQ